MAIKRILLCLTSLSSAETLPRAAAPLARRLGAQLIAIHILESLIMYPAISMHLPETCFSGFNKSQKAHSDEIKAIFHRHTKSPDLKSEWRLEKADTATATIRMLDNARAADLVIMAKESDAPDWTYGEDLVGKTIRNCGRPVLVIPEGFRTDGIGERIVLGCRTTKKAEQTTRDLLNIAARGADVGLVAIDETGDDNPAINDLVKTFIEHGLHPDILPRVPSDKTGAEDILHKAHERQADQIVVAGSRAAPCCDKVVGPLVEDLLRSATLPVLYSR